MQESGDGVEMVAGFVFLGSEIYGDGDYSHEVKSHLPLGGKTKNLGKILKGKTLH